MNKEKITGMIREVVDGRYFKIDEPMYLHTSFKVGGPADILITPKDKDQLARVIEICRKTNTHYLIIGNGSNLIVRDKGIRGVVIKIYEEFSGCEVKGETIEAEAGILLSKIANIALQHELSGFEFASGIPGTLGGAVTMNAGAYGGEMKDVVTKTEFMDENGNLKQVEGEEHKFAYRSSVIQKQGGVVLKSVLKLKRGKRSEIEQVMNDLTKRRTDKQPLDMPSAGSVFKRPEGFFTGKLIEDCGLRGYKMGGAEVSCKHCGFIVNAGEATASDIIRLIEYIKSEVKGRFGIDLQTEVKIIGEE